MNNMDIYCKILMDELKTARICAGAKMEELCNENEHTQACVFQAIRDSLAQNIELLQSYNTLYGKLKEKNNNIEVLEQEPILDRIRTEIDAESAKSFKYPNWERAKALEWTLSIIDKYIAESDDCKNDVLDKIRADIEQLRLHKAQFLTNNNKVCIDSQEVLDVIDKYKLKYEE